jgi:hypothetical protein
LVYCYASAKHFHHCKSIAQTFCNQLKVGFGIIRRRPLSI